MSEPLQALLEKSVPFRTLEQTVENNKFPMEITGAPISMRPQLASTVADRTGRPVVVITNSEQDARDYAALAGKDAMFLPDADLTLRNIEGKSRDEEMERLGVLKRADEASVVFMSVHAALQPVIPKEQLTANLVEFEKGCVYELADVTKSLTRAAYERVGTVYSKGEFAQRGEILDVFPADSEAPVRITFFDDEVESVRYFDPDTQKSIGKPLESVQIPPAKEVILSDAQSDKLRAYLGKQKGSLSALSEEITTELNEFGAPANVATMSSLLYEQKSPISYFENPVVLYDGLGTMLQEADRIAMEFESEYDRLEKENAVLPAQKNALLTLGDILQENTGNSADFATFSDGPFSSGERVDLRIASTSGFSGRMELLSQTIQKYSNEGGHVYLFAGKKAAILSSSLADYGLDLPILTTLTGDERMAIVPESIPAGFEIGDTHTLVLGMNDIFGHVKQRVKHKKKKQFAEDIFSDLKPGDIVVEERHGKGRYLGLTTVKNGNSVGEYMEIEYRDGDKLYISTSKIEGVEKYVGADPDEVILSKLGSQEWEKAKTRVRESTKKLAFDMMKLYSNRFRGTGYAFSPDTVWQHEFEDAFAYEETDGQLESTEQIKKDMESARPMDRLLLGDVGYGKTEVAMRAAFKAVMDGKQVAVLVPTTLLARQHLATFRDRFKGFPVTIAGMSRFAKSGQKETLEGLESGKVDILIGTHRILSNDIHFHDLGLLIIDEEQRFGVNQKEKIKTIREQVDVLTLSATPIPRTLEMSLTGIRDMSTIETPPAMKKEPYTYVTRYTGGLLHDALARELKRGGQAYVVCRQIGQMDKVMEDVHKAVPNARICAAHGQMPEKEMEDVVSGFLDGEYDIMVCTTIIENGIDIPNVNTIVVYEADMFGLSQLYQLKGRVGRADQTSYAYFTYNSGRELKEAAARRLQAIREFTELGSGFKIAMRDLQIRGAGNLLGAEQSGHMSTVGYAMYCRMMNEAVEEAKGRPVEEELETTVELNVPAYIPDSYVASQADKMDIYRMIAKIRSIADAKDVRADMKDRYGKLPKEVDNLIIASVIKCYASRAGLASVICKKDAIEMRYAEEKATNVDVKRLLQMTMANKDRVVLRPTNPPTIVYKSKGLPGKHFLEFVAGLASRAAQATREATQATHEAVQPTAS